jgi:hypothetical protein
MSGAAKPKRSQSDFNMDLAPKFGAGAKENLLLSIVEGSQDDENATENAEDTI